MFSYLEKILTFWQFWSQQLKTTYRISVASGVGRLNAPSRNRKKCCRKLVLSSRCYLSENRQKSRKYWLKNYEKNQFFIEIFIKKSQNFCCKRTKLWRLVLKFPCLMEIIRQKPIFLNFDTNYSRFSPKFSRNFTPFPIILLDVSHFWVFW